MIRKRHRTFLFLALLVVFIFAIQRRSGSSLWSREELVILERVLSQDLKPNSEDSPEWIQTHLYKTDPVTEYTIPKELAIGDAVTYKYDPRLTRAVYMHHIAKQLQPVKGVKEVSVPFTWYDWVDIGRTIDRFVTLPKNEKFDCSLLCATVLNKPTQKEINEKLERLGSEPFFDLSKTKNLKGTAMNLPKIKQEKLCSRYCTDDKTTGHPGFKVFDNLLKSKSAVRAILQSASYLYSSAPSPQSLVFALNHGNLQVDVISNEEMNNKQAFNILNQGLVKDYVKDKQTLSIDVSEDYKNFINKLRQYQPLFKPRDKFNLVLDHSRFLFNAPQYLEINSKPNTRHQISFQESLRSSLSKKDSILRKHFIEVSSLSVSGASHFDWRFYNGQKLNLEEKQSILSRMLRTWSEFTRSAGIVSWISHGVLLSHNFNGIPFPWDDDLDIQLPFQDFVKLAEKFNGSLIIEDPSIGYGSYYLDITDSITHRSYGNGLNNIDGRFIDTQSGLFIDLTALAVSSNDLPLRYEKEFKSLKVSTLALENVDPNVVIDDMYSTLTTEERDFLKRKDPTTHRALDALVKQKKKKPGLTKDLQPEQRFDVNHKLQLYNCRNGHFYKLDDLTPLRLSQFDQSPVYVPDKIQKILSEEYVAQPMLSNSFNKYTFIPQLRIWVPEGEIKKIDLLSDKTDLNMLTESEVVELLKNEYILENFRRTHTATLFNEKDNFISKDLDIQVELKSNLLSGLRMKNPKPISKDLFSLRVERERKSTIDISPYEIELLDSMTKEIKEEYGGLVRYESEINYNSVGWTYKKILEVYRKSIYDPDLEIKIKKAEKIVNSIKNKDTLLENQNLLKDLLAKKAELEKLQGLNEAKLPNIETMELYQKSSGKSSELDDLVPEEPDKAELLDDE